MKIVNKLSVAAFFIASLTACEVERTQEGEMPNVDVDGGQVPKYEIEKTQEGEMPDVDVDGGKMPKYNVKTPDVEIGTETKEVEVPTIDVEMPEDESRTAGRDD